MQNVLRISNGESKHERKKLFNNQHDRYIYSWIHKDIQNRSTWLENALLRRNNERLHHRPRVLSQWARRNSFLCESTHFVECSVIFCSVVIPFRCKFKWNAVALLSALQLNESTFPVYVLIKLKQVNQMSSLTNISHSNCIHATSFAYSLYIYWGGILNNNHFRPFPFMVEWIGPMPKLKPQIFRSTTILLRSFFFILHS